MLKGTTILSIETTEHGFTTLDDAETTMMTTETTEHESITSHDLDLTTRTYTTSADAQDSTSPATEITTLFELDSTTVSQKEATTPSQEKSSFHDYSTPLFEEGTTYISTRQQEDELSTQPVDNSDAASIGMILYIL